MYEPSPLVERAWHVYPRCLAAVAVISLLGACSQNEAIFKPPAVGRQAWFLDQLKSLADSNDLSDPVAVGTILKITFVKRVIATSPSHMESFGKTFERDEYMPTARTWFVPGPPGYASTLRFMPARHREGFASGMDPVEVGDTATVKYFESKRYGLSEKDSLGNSGEIFNDSQTSLFFYGIDSLTCITLTDVRANFPGLVHMDATDIGSERYVYYRTPNAEPSTVLTFSPPEGQCITEAHIDQFKKLSRR
jgi:hypothetical protein